MNPAFTGKSKIEIESVAIETPPDARLLDFKVYTRVGMTAYLDDGVRPVVFEKLKPITTRDGLKPGMALLFENAFGGLWRAIVQDNLMDADGEEVFAALAFDEGHPDVGIGPEWVGTSFGAVKSLSRIDFA